jgi:hypothetical protein
LQSGDLRNARALAYDMVYNGVEIGGGSLRIYRRDIQAQVGGWAPACTLWLRIRAISARFINLQLLNFLNPGCRCLPPSG